MSFLRARNPNLDRRYDQIARLYRRHGEALGVRWDYAFFQMAIETNFLTFRAPNGRRGDVDPRQNNFAGIGTTGGGVPGDSYPDVSTGVLAQLQHLVVYSGERIEDPVAPRTRLKQDHILALSAPIAARRPVTFQDLSGRWAVDRAYGRSIQWVADQFKAAHCNTMEEQVAGDSRAPGRLAGRTALGAPDEAKPRPLIRSQAPSTIVPPAPKAATRVIASNSIGAAAGVSRHAATMRSPPTAPLAPIEMRAGLHDRTEAMSTAPCRVMAASFGGRRAVVIEQFAEGERVLTALTVHDGFERSMAAGYIRERAPGGSVLSEHADTSAALASAHLACNGSPDRP